MGSSPRMRGSPENATAVDHVLGIIPAHAGLTSISMYSSIPARDHPRACGAHSISRLKSRLKRGSSPRMRGSLIVDLLKDGTAGIIPAHAGLTLLLCRQDESSRDHPRACGAHVYSIVRQYIDEGSSPRMRGSPINPNIGTVTHRIIPAHAGLTNPRCPRRTWHRDHPRACGAHRWQVLSLSRVRGSSPRMRGSLLIKVREILLVGIIPAHAGLTLKNPNIDAILSGPHPIFYSVLRVIR